MTRPVASSASDEIHYRPLALLLGAPAFAQTVTDGATIKLNGTTTWRLWGIDAPEARQTCADAWAAGREATAALRRLIEVGFVACELRRHDRYGRSIGLCRAGGKIWAPRW
jgi:endonuclease YncB( thermonuclease family)